MAHRYFVAWSAPNYRGSGMAPLTGMTSVMADNQPEAIKKAKKKLGAKVKKQYLSEFRAWRSVPHLRKDRFHKSGLEPTPRSIYR